MPTSTARLALQQPLGSDPVSEYRVATANNAATLDGATLILSGTAASRPTAGTIGRFYLATDTGELTFDTGSAWFVIHGSVNTTLTYATITTNQTFGAGTTNVVQLNSATNDAGNNFNTTTHVYTVPQGGNYQMFGQIGFSNAFANSQLVGFKNGTAVLSGDSPSNGSVYIVAGTISASPGDTLALAFINGSNASQQVLGSAAFMQVNRISVH